MSGNAETHAGQGQQLLNKLVTGNQEKIQKEKIQQLVVGYQDGARSMTSLKLKDDDCISARLGEKRVSGYDFSIFRSLQTGTYSSENKKRISAHSFSRKRIHIRSKYD